MENTKHANIFVFANENISGSVHSKKFESSSELEIKRARIRRLFSFSFFDFAQKLQRVYVRIRRNRQEKKSKREGKKIEDDY